MRFILDIETHGPNRTEREVRRLLDDVKLKLAAGFDHHAILDANGNRIGEWTFEATPTIHIQDVGFNYPEPICRQTIEPGDSTNTQRPFGTEPNCDHCISISESNRYG